MGETRRTIPGCPKTSASIITCGPELRALKLWKALLLTGRSAHRLTLRPQQLPTHDSQELVHKHPAPSHLRQNNSEARTLYHFPGFVRGKKLWSPTWSLA